MPSAIGVRFYKLIIKERGTNNVIDMNSGTLKLGMQEFVKKFIEDHTVTIQDDSLERSWYFESKESEQKGVFRGYIRYGTYGFESNFVDPKTKNNKYHRQTSDVEVIPLYYEYWIPSVKNLAIVALQSFQGRSCINLMMTQMKKKFDEENKKHILFSYKILPNDVKGSAYLSSPVKKLRLIKKNTSADLADQYFDNPNPDAIDFEVIMSARRRKSLGTLGGLLSTVKSNKENVIVHEGLNFTEAVAQIKVGGRTRQVGVLGGNRDAGVIDLTDAIIRGKDGHPTFQSLRKEVGSLMIDFIDTLDGNQS